MSKFKRLVSLMLPILMVGCQAVGPGKARWSAPGATAPQVQGAASGLAAAGGLLQAETRTSSAAKGAVISLDPGEVQRSQPAGFATLVIDVKWPARPKRSLQYIPDSASTLWVKVFQGKLGNADGTAAPTSSVLAERVLVRNDNASPDPNKGASNGLTPAATYSVYLSLPPGDATVWAGSYQETAPSSSSVYLSSVQRQVSLTANRVARPGNFILVGNSQVVPQIASLWPPYVGPGGTLTISGANFDPTASNNQVELYVPPSCNYCGSQQYSLTASSASSTSITVAIPAQNQPQTQYWYVDVTTNGMLARSSSQVGVLAADDWSNLSFDPGFVKSANVGPNNTQIYATLRGSRVKLGALKFDLGNNLVPLPLSMAAVTASDGSTRSIDPDGTFVASGSSSINYFDVIAGSGIATHSLRVYAGTWVGTGTRLAFNRDCSNCSPAVSNLVMANEEAYFGDTQVSSVAKTAYPELPPLGLKVHFGNSDYTVALDNNDFNWSTSTDNRLTFVNNSYYTIGDSPAGSAVITATSIFDANRQVTGSLKVGLQSIAITPGEIYLSQPQQNASGNQYLTQQQLGVTVVAANGATATFPSQCNCRPGINGNELLWDTSNPNLFSVTTGGLVQSIGPSNDGIVKASLFADDAFYATASVHVNNYGGLPINVY